MRAHAALEITFSAMASWATGFGLVCDRLVAAVLCCVAEPNKVSQTGLSEQDDEQDEEEDDVLRSMGGVRCLTCLVQAWGSHCLSLYFVQGALNVIQYCI